MSFWKAEFEMETSPRRVFKVLAQKENGKVIVPDDFKPLFKIMMLNPGFASRM